MTKPIGSFKILHAGETEAKNDEDTKFYANAAELKGIFAHQRLEADSLLYSTRLEYRNIRVNEDEIGSQELYNIALGFSYIDRPEGNSLWTHTYLVEPGIYSDFDSVDGDDWGIAARYSALYAPEGDWRYVMGIGVGRQFGDPRFYPIGGGIYQPNVDFMLTLAFPSTIMQYRFDPKWELYSYLRPIGNQWNVSNVVPDEVEAIQPEGSVDFVATGWNLSLGIDRKITERLWLGAELGRLMAQEYKFENEAGNKLRVDIKDRFNIALALKWKVD